MTLFTTIIPVLVIALLKSYRKIGDADLNDRKERFIPLLAMIACYTLCAVAIAGIPSAQMLIERVNQYVQTHYDNAQINVCP